MAEGGFQFRGSDIEPSPASEAVTVDAVGYEDGDLLLLTAGVMVKGADNEIPTHLAMGEGIKGASTIALPLHKGMILQGVFTDASLVPGDAVGLEVTGGVQTFGTIATTKCGDVVKVLDAIAKVALVRMRNAAVSA